MPYFSENINFHPNGEIQSQNGKWIMMEWEREIMEASARAICINGGDILNVGFGMGIIDSYIQLLKPKNPLDYRRPP
jgi:type IV protein arginine methyltransferase